MTTTTSPKPLRFYLGKTIKRICLDTGFVDVDSPMFVAKWDGLYVIAKDNDNFFLATSAQASEYVRTERDEKNKIKYAPNGPTILPVGERFKWTVECGNTCPNGGDETVVGSSVVQNKEAAMNLAAQWDGTQVRGTQGFLRIRGPAFYEIRRCTPRPVVPTPLPSRPQAQTVPTRPMVNSQAIDSAARRGAYWHSAESQYHEGYESMVWPRIRTSVRTMSGRSRLSDEMLRAVQTFQRATTVPAAIPDPELDEGDLAYITGAPFRRR